MYWNEFERKKRFHIDYFNIKGNFSKNNSINQNLQDLIIFTACFHEREIYTLFIFRQLKLLVVVVIVGFSIEIIYTN